MFRIRNIYDDTLPVNREAIQQVQEILRRQIADVPNTDVEGIVEKLRNPFAQRFRSMLSVAERHDRKVLGFALVLHEARLRMFYLDYIAAHTKLTSRGIGGALYEWVREDARELGMRGLFFECLPDEPRDCPEKEKLAANRARLRFYEHFGARPIVGTAYTKPLGPEDSCMPYLVYDGLGRGEPLRRRFAREAVRAILERKYAHVCPPAYVEEVVRSFRDDPVRLREPRYRQVSTPADRSRRAPVLAVSRERIALFVNDRHDIHHVNDRGYVEAPARVTRILAELEKTSAFEPLKPRERSLDHIKQVHDSGFVEYLKRVCHNLPPKKTIYPYVFPIRNASRPPVELALRAGYYCIDTFTPLNHNAFLAARRGVDCVLAAAEEIRFGRRLAYALVRPPGHHAERRVFGGFCYFNNAAVAAHYLASLGRIAILDIDYHHGNGQQDIFYARDDVLTISIHGHPRFAYPYFSGYAEEQGEGAGRGFNLNIPLPESIDGPRYREALDHALRRIRRFNPLALVVALGLDTAKGDPTGTWHLKAEDFAENGRRIGALGLPVLVTQEGGYRTRTLGRNARHFFEGLIKGGRPS